MSVHDDDSKFLVPVERGGLAKESTSALIVRGLQDLANMPQWSIRKLWDGKRVSASISPFGQVALYSSDVFGQIKVFDPRCTDPLQFVLQGSDYRTDWEMHTACFSWSPDGNFLLMAENSSTKNEPQQYRNQVVLLDLRTGEFRNLRPTTQYRWSLFSEWSNSGRYAAIGRAFDSAEPIILWSFDKGRAIDCKYAANNVCDSIVWRPAFSPDERFLAALCYEIPSRSILVIFEVPSLKLVKRFELNFGPTVINWRSDQKNLLLAGVDSSELTAVFDLEREEVLRLPFLSSYFAECNPVRPIAAFGTHLRMTIGDLALGTILSDQSLDADDSISDMSWSSDGNAFHAISMLGRAYTCSLLGRG
jgi:WD40 repeat protein